MKKIIILGGGMVGSAIAADLATDFDVTVADIDPVRIRKLRLLRRVHFRKGDLSSARNVKAIVREFDLVIGALPGHLGFKTLKSVIEAKKNIVDISFFKEDPFALDALAKKNCVTAVVDCGIAPGLGNIIVGYHSTKMKIDRFECYVGGLPFKRTWPFQYKAPFSARDVIEEYVRPARMVENGKIIVKPALSEPEWMEFENIGTLEAFNTDGLRTLLKTMPIPNMKEKTLRYPGHGDIMRVLKDTGFFSDKAIEFEGRKIRPVDLTARLLFPHWKLAEREKEFTVLRLIIEGEGGRIAYNLFDAFDAESRITSMARTTGYTCAAVARLIIEGRFGQKGISPPEFVGRQKECFDAVASYLEARKVRYTKIAEKITA